MNFIETKLEGVYVVELNKIGDDRGFFARTYCEDEFEAQGLVTPGVQCNMSFNNTKGTLRGLHFQQAPHAETKLVRCSRGSIWDVAVDLRTGSDTYLMSFGIELSADNRLALYIPQEFAHGFQTLEDNTEVTYQVTSKYRPDAETGYKYNDSRLDIRWPLPVSCISDKDQSWSSL